MSLSITIKAEKAKKRFRDLQKRVSNPSTAMDVIATKAWKNVQKHFRDEKGKGGKTWPRLKNPRVHWAPGITEPKLRGGTKVLQDTGTLRSSISFRSLKKEAHVFTRSPYAGIHNFGGNVPARKPRRKKFLKMYIGGQKIFTKYAKGFRMQKREFMYLDKRARKSINQFFLRYWVDGAKA